jgi:enoyl-CoA hydratase/carnithine racemase
MPRSGVAQALDIGLITRVVPDAPLPAESLALARELAAAIERRQPKFTGR